MNKKGKGGEKKKKTDGGEQGIHLLRVRARVQILSARRGSVPAGIVVAQCVCLRSASVCAVRLSACLQSLRSASVCVSVCASEVTAQAG